MTDDNMAKALRGEPVEITLPRLHEMREQAMAAARLHERGHSWMNWHWVAVLNGVIAARTAETGSEPHAICKECGHALAFDEVGPAAPAEAPQAPIARLAVLDDGQPGGVTMYAPGLPPGDHDLFAAPVGPGEWQPFMRGAEPASEGPASYTRDDIAALVRDLQAVEDGTESPPLRERDHRTRAGVLWRVIASLAGLADQPGVAQ